MEEVKETGDGSLSPFVAIMLIWDCWRQIKVR